jgi:HSP20 family protein
VWREEFYSEVDRLFGAASHGQFEPNADVYIDETARRMVVHVELAGADSEGLSVAVDDRFLYISGRRVERNDARTCSMLQKEIQYGEFSKRIRLPMPVLEDGATATYRDGILTIVLPLAARERFPVVRTEIRMTITRTLA